MYKIIEIENEKIIKKNNLDNSISYIPMHESNADYQAYLEHLTQNPSEDVE
jgi:hypothetical protein